MTLFRANRKFPNPITVTDDPRSHTLALQQIIEALNIGQRRTKEVDSSFVRVDELVDAGLIEMVGSQLKATNTSSSSGATTLDGLTDVDTTGVVDGYTLVYDAGTATWLVAAPSGGSTSPLTTKGDLWGFTTVDARVGVGANGTLLQADSTAAAGVAWSATLTGNYNFTGFPTFTGGMSASQYIDVNATGFSPGDHSWWFVNDDFASGQKYWAFYVNTDGSSMQWLGYGDGPGYAPHPIIKATRSGATITGLQYGNSTDLPDHTFWSGQNFKINVDNGTADKQFLWLVGDGTSVGYTVTSDQIAGPASGYAWQEVAVFGKTTNAVNNSSAMWLGHYRGSQASPAASQAGDELGEIIFAGKCTTTSQVGIPGTIRGVVESAAAGNLGGGLSFWTHPGSGGYYSGLVNRLQIMSNGEIRLGVDGYMRFDLHSSAPSTPSSGNVAVYAKSDKKLYIKDDAGLETALTSPPVATDTIWDAKGDLAVGTGADTASKLAVGTDGYALIADSAESTGMKWAPVPASGSGNYGNKSVDNPPVAPDSMDDEFNGSSLDAKWSWFNQGAATVSVARGVAKLTLATEVTGTWRGIQQTLPAGNWRFESRIAADLSAVNSQSSCFSIRENSTAKTLVVMRSYTGGTYQWAVNYYTNDTTFSSSLWSNTSLASGGWEFRNWAYFAIEYDGTNYYFEISTDGIAWTRVATAAKASYFTADRIAYAIRNGNSGATFSTSCDWVRKIGASYDVTRIGGTGYPKQLGYAGL